METPHFLLILYAKLGEKSSVRRKVLKKFKKRAPKDENNPLKLLFSVSGPNRGQSRFVIIHFGLKRPFFLCFYSLFQGHGKIELFPLA